MKYCIYPETQLRLDICMNLLSITMFCKQNDFEMKYTAIQKYSEDIWIGYLVTFVTQRSCPSSIAPSVTVTSHVITGHTVSTVSYTLLTTVYTVPTFCTFYSYVKNIKASIFFLKQKVRLNHIVMLATTLKTAFVLLYSENQLFSKDFLFTFQNTDM